MIVILCNNSSQSLTMYNEVNIILINTSCIDCPASVSVFLRFHGTTNDKCLPI